MGCAASFFISASVVVILIVELIMAHKKLGQYRRRLEKKDEIISTIIRGLPILFLEGERDGEFVFNVQTRPDYDGRYLRVSWICEGKNKEAHNSKIMRYFLHLNSLGLNAQPTILTDRPYQGRIVLESYHEMEATEMQYELYRVNNE